MEGSVAVQSLSTGPAQAPTSVDKVVGPVPMSFPAILRAPGLADRYAHLRVAVDRAQIVAPSVPKKNKRDDKEGRRWIRRKENGLCLACFPDWP